MIEDFVHRLHGLQVSRETVADDPMNNGPPFYFETGLSALRLVMTAMLARTGYIGGSRPIRSILDFGCGYGRVLRWLRAAFPDSVLTVSDLNRSAALWCAERFSAVVADEPLVEEDHYDLIFLGSVFTHMLPTVVQELINKSIRALKRDGILLFTTMGRFACINAEADPKARIFWTIPPEALAQTLEAFRKTGYGFVPHPNRQDYGSSWIAQTWFAGVFKERSDVIQILFQEKGWDNFQDAYAYLKAPLAEKARSRM